MPRRPGRNLKGPFITTGNPDTVNDAFPSVTTIGSAYDLRGQLGQIFQSADGLKEWIYCQFSSTSTGKTPAATQICYFWSSTSTSTTNPDPTWIVDNQTSAGNATKVTQVAGILRNACTRGNGVWLLRKAPTCSVVSTTTGFITGNAVIATTASGEAAFLVSTSTAFPAGGMSATGTFIGVPLLGYVNSTTTSSVAIDVCLDIE